MGWSDEIRGLREWVRAWVPQQLTTLLGWTQVSNTSAIGDGDAVEVSDDVKGQRPVTRVEPFGHRGRTPNGLRGLWIRLGSSNVFFVGIGPTQKYGPQDLDQGEVAVYNITKAVMRLWKTGKLTLDADTGQDVVVNGGSAKVGRVGDTVDMGSWQVTVGSGAVTAITWIPPGGGTPVSIPVAPAPAVDLTGKITSGANNFKA